jgi:hypothetical protein
MTAATIIAAGIRAGRRGILLLLLLLLLLVSGSGGQGVRKQMLLMGRVRMRSQRAAGHSASVRSITQK